MPDRLDTEPAEFVARGEFLFRVGDRIAHPDPDGTDPAHRRGSGRILRIEPMMHEPLIIAWNGEPGTTVRVGITDVVVVDECPHERTGENGEDVDIPARRYRYHLRCWDCHEVLEYGERIRDHYKVKFHHGPGWGDESHCYATLAAAEHASETHRLGANTGSSVTLCDCKPERDARPPFGGIVEIFGFSELPPAPTDTP